MTGDRTIGRMISALEKGPSIILHAKDPELADWRREAVRRGYEWLEATVPDRPEPLGVWTGLLESDAAVKQFRSLTVDEDLDEPSLRDARSFRKFLADWLRNRLKHGPVTLCLKRLECADLDSLLAMEFIARSFVDDRLAFILIAGPEDANGHWTKTYARLSRDIGIAGHLAAPQTSEPIPRQEEPPSISDGLYWCRHGAVHAGARMLASGLDVSGNDDDGTGWLTLALVATQLQDYEMSDMASDRALRSLRDSRAVRRARRVHLLALRRAGRLDAFRRLKSEYCKPLSVVALQPDHNERAWDLFDIALATSQDQDPSEHRLSLDRILSMPQSDISPNCLAAASIWRAALCYVQGDLTDALTFQTHGLSLLDERRDFSRVLLLSSRLGGLLAACGHHDQAIDVLTSAAGRAIAAGEPVLAAHNIAEAANAAQNIGDLRAAQNALPKGWAAAYVWASPVGQCLRFLTLAHVSIAERDYQTADQHYRRLADALNSDLIEEESWAIRLWCRASYVRADIARCLGQSHMPFVVMGLKLAERTGPEERGVLMALGRQRL